MHDKTIDRSADQPPFLELSNRREPERMRPILDSTIPEDIFRQAANSGHGNVEKLKKNPNIEYIIATNFDG